MKDDNGLEIPRYEGTCDFEDLFENLEILNKLNKYAEISYFKCENSEKLMKYFKCLDLIEVLGYNKSGVYECIGDCYANKNDLKSAISYMSRAIKHC